MGSELRGSPDTSDGAAIRRSIDQSAAFGLIFDRHFDAVYGYLVRRMGPGRAEDLASATFTVAFERRDRFRSDATTARPWLLGIATNLLRNERRAERRALAALAWTDVSHAATEPTLPADLARLGRLLAGLPREQRDVLLLHAWEDLSYEEIAQAVGVPVGTVRSRLARARERLRQALNDERRLGTEAQEVS